MRAIILGSSLDAICAAHVLLDSSSNIEIQIITERAEIGLMGEIPGLISSWPPCSPDWISEMASQAPNHTSTAVRGSWFVKALGIQLSKRGCQFHLKTRVTKITETEVHVIGAGNLAKGKVVFDHLLDFRPNEQSNTIWHGIVCRTEDTPEYGISGERSDGTTEVWTKHKPQGNKTSLQEMTWFGTDPSLHISSGVTKGMRIANGIVDKIIHPIEQ